ncbi:hypothetical protein OKW38_000047 [Paraburkholderia sp. MM5496-R1]
MPDAVHQVAPPMRLDRRHATAEPEAPAILSVALERDIELGQSGAVSQHASRAIPPITAAHRSCEFRWFHQSTRVKMWNAPLSRCVCQLSRNRLLHRSGQAIRSEENDRAERDSAALPARYRAGDLSRVGSRQYGSDWAAVHFTVKAPRRVPVSPGRPSPARSPATRPLPPASASAQWPLPEPACSTRNA